MQDLKNQRPTQLVWHFLQNVGVDIVKSFVVSPGGGSSNAGGASSSSGKKWPFASRTHARPDVDDGTLQGLLVQPPTTTAAAGTTATGSGSGAGSVSGASNFSGEGGSDRGERGVTQHASQHVSQHASQGYGAFGAYESIAEGDGRESALEGVASGYSGASGGSGSAFHGFGGSSPPRSAGNSKGGWVKKMGKMGAGVKKVGVKFFHHGKGDTPRGEQEDD